MAGHDTPTRMQSMGGMTVQCSCVHDANGKQTLLIQAICEKTWTAKMAANSMNSGCKPCQQRKSVNITAHCLLGSVCMHSSSV